MGNYASVRIYICSYGQFGGEELVLPWRLWRYGPLTMMLHSHPSRGNYPRGTWHDALAARGARAAWRREGGGGAEGVPKCYKLGTVAGFSRCVTTLYLGIGFPAKKFKPGLVTRHFQRQRHAF